MKEIKNNLLDFVFKLAPNADLIRDFNGSYVFLIPLSKKFKPSRLYKEMETNKDRLLIQDWGLCQSSLEDVFTKICE